MPGTFMDIIITGADARYYPVALGLLDSLAAAPMRSDTVIGFCDFGLSPEQRDALVARGIIVRTVDWYIDFIAQDRWEQELPGFRSMIARPFMPEIFPGYGRYLWMDADTWVQSSDAIDVLFDAADAEGFAAVPELDRTYLKYRADPRIWLAERECVRDCLDEDTAARLFLRPVVNSGVFAVRADAPHSAAWQKRLRAGLAGRSFHPAQKFIDQNTLNAALHLDGLPFAALPAAFNWLVGQSHPAWDVNTKRFVSPALPHEPLHVLHLTWAILLQSGGIRCVGYQGPKALLNAPFSFHGQQEREEKTARLLVAIASRR